MKKDIIGILYSIVSICWLFVSLIFISALWLTSRASKKWEEDVMFIPVGIIMIIVWIVSLIALVIKLKRKKK